MIPVNEPRIGAREVELVTEALTSGWISGAGPHIERFEQEWARYCERKHGIAVASNPRARRLGATHMDHGRQPGGPAHHAKN